MSRSDDVSQFCAVTAATEAEAINMLEATNYDLQSAIELFFAAGTDVGSGSAGPSIPAPAPDDEALARQLQEQCVPLI
jgi:UBA-like domain